MEKINEEKTKTKVPNKDVSFDWFGLAIELGSYVLQGACLAAGGIVVTEGYRGLSKTQPRDAHSPNVAPFKRSTAV